MAVGSHKGPTGKPAMPMQTLPMRHGCRKAPQTGVTQGKSTYGY
jgi:hypothetical protein